MRARVALLLPLLLLVQGARAEGEETSDSYLRNVVSELRLLHGLGPAGDSQAQESQRVYEEPEQRPSPVPQAQEAVQYATLPQTVQSGGDYYYQPRQPPRRKPPSYQPPPEIDDYPIQPTENTRYAPEKVSVLGLSTRELAAMYRKAIEFGSPVRYQTLMDTMGQPQEPKIVSTRYELAAAPRPPETQYAYYFYPLNTFQHELVNNYGYKTMPPMNFDSMPAANNKKEMSPMNPLLVGIGSFLGTALVFVLSLFLYPRFVNLMSFPFANVSRSNLHGELSYLRAFVAEAIDFYNSRNRKSTWKNKRVNGLDVSGKGKVSSM